jgi:hypothetical protein
MASLIARQRSGVCQGMVLINVMAANLCRWFNAVNGQNTPTFVLALNTNQRYQRKN